MVATQQPAEFSPMGLRMLTISEVARLLGAHINSVRRWADMGLLPSYRIGFRGDRRFRPDEISSFLAAQRQEQRARPNSRGRGPIDDRTGG